VEERFAGREFSFRGGERKRATRRGMKILEGNYRKGLYPEKAWGRFQVAPPS